MGEIRPLRPSDVVEWREPPAVRPSRLQRVIAELQRRPGEWAQIATSSPLLMTWWTPLSGMPDFEVTTRRSHENDTTLFGPRDVYARYLRPRYREGATPAD